MLTIDLEKTLLRENKKIIIPEELLLINEYEKFEKFVDNDALERIGFDKNIKTGKNIKERIFYKKEQTKNFNQDRVFHVSQIQSICEKYRLKFLPINFYRGTIDENLPTRITTFELAHNVKCDSTNTAIIAPRGSFNLEDKPKDPLFFYKINDEYYYLIHKWGNDLSVFRRILPIFESNWTTWIVSMITILSIHFLLDMSNLVFIGVFSFGCSVFIGVFALTDDISLSILSKNDWNSIYRN